MTKEEVYGLIDTHYRKNHSTLGKIYRNEDIVQEAYARACQYWDSYNSEYGFDKWFSQIIRNCLFDHIKDTRLNGMVDVEFAPEDEIHSDFLDNVRVKEVLSLIEMHNEDEQQILKLAILQQYRPREIAKIVPFKRNHISTIVYRFKDKAREMLG